MKEVQDQLSDDETFELSYWMWSAKFSGTELLGQSTDQLLGFGHLEFGGEPIERESDREERRNRVYDNETEKRQRKSEREGRKKDVVNKRKRVRDVEKERKMCVFSKLDKIQSN